MDTTELRDEVHRLREREQRIAELIGCTDTAKLEHDVRNVLNELALLRKLAEMEDQT
ncbi:MAG: hypothetical protein AAF743_12235 [Planctomycetota bacterium]